MIGHQLGPYRVLEKLGAGQGTLRGWGAREVEETVRRVSSVAPRDATDTAAQFDTLFLQHTLLYARADFRALRDLDLELERLAANDVTCWICADMGIGGARTGRRTVGVARAGERRTISCFWQPLTMTLGSWA